MRLVLFNIVVFLAVAFEASSYDLSMDERIIKCIDWEDKSAPMATVQLDQKDQNYHICLHTCWNLGYYYMAIKPGCASTECVCLTNYPTAMKQCDQQLFDDCESRKSLPLYHAAVSDEDHAVMTCMPDSDADSQLNKYKELYVTSVSQCLDECQKNKPTGKDIKKVLAGITSGCDRIGKCGQELKCKCVTTSPSVSVMGSSCIEPCDAGLTRCRKRGFTALYYTNNPLHTGTSGNPLSLRSIIMISIFSSILVIFFLIFIAFVIRAKLRGESLPTKTSGSVKAVDNQGTYRGKSSPSGLTSSEIYHPSLTDSPRPSRAAPAPPPPPAFNKPYMPNYQTPQKPPSSSSAITPLINNTQSTPKHTYDDAGYVSPTIIKSNKYSSQPHQGENERSSYNAKVFHDNHLVDNDSRTSSFSSIKALFDSPKNGTPVFKPSPLVSGGNSSNKPSPVIPKHSSYDSSLSAPYPPQSSQTSPCYMNTNGFF